MITLVKSTKQGVDIFLRHSKIRSILIKDYGDGNVLTEVFNGDKLVGENVLRLKKSGNVDDAKQWLEEFFSEPVQIVDGIQPPTHKEIPCL